jgi:hypothetical protein
LAQSQFKLASGCGCFFLQETAKQTKLKVNKIENLIYLIF